jgi:hypothetical protein
MSSAATLTFSSETIGVPADSWRGFCAEHDIVHSPHTVGGNVYYAGGIQGIEITYDQHRLRFSTYYGGKAIADVARLALIAWRLWGGQLMADEEIRCTMFPPATGKGRQ